MNINVLVPGVAVSNLRAKCDVKLTTKLTFSVLKLR